MIGLYVLLAIKAVAKKQFKKFFYLNIIANGMFATEIYKCSNTDQYVFLDRKNSSKEILRYTGKKSDGSASFVRTICNLLEQGM